MHWASHTPHTQQRLDRNGTNGQMIAYQITDKLSALLLLPEVVHMIKNYYDVTQVMNC